jgi:hypothetical protein
MAMELSKRAVAIAMWTSIPRVTNTGIKMKAAPTPAMVSSVVRMSVMNPAKTVVIISDSPILEWATSRSLNREYTYGSRPQSLNIPLIPAPRTDRMASIP